MKNIKSYKGNLELLNTAKTAFLCSRQVPADIILKCYDWAIEMRKTGQCVVGGFHSPLEKDVLHFLLKGKQPIIIVLARGMKKKIEPELVEGINEGRILIIAPFDDNVTRVNSSTANKRNEVMLELADEVTVGYARPESRLQDLLGLYPNVPKSFL